MTTNSGILNSLNKDVSGITDLHKENIEEIEEVKPDFTPERLEGESFEDYKERRKAVKKWQKRVHFRPDDEGLNRNGRREKIMYGRGTHMSGSALSGRNPFKKRLRLTKPIRKVRGKYMYGMIKDENGKLELNDITEAVKKGLPTIPYARMRKMGLTLKNYLNIAQDTEKNIKKLISEKEANDVERK